MQLPMDGQLITRRDCGLYIIYTTSILTTCISYNLTIGIIVTAYEIKFN